jgi:hypothetical protein
MPGLPPNVPDPGDLGPDVGATPELDSLALMATGLLGMGGYGMQRWRASRRRGPRDEGEPGLTGDDA